MTIFVPEALLRHATKREVTFTIDTTSMGPLQIKNTVRMALSGVITGCSVSAHIAATLRKNLKLPVYTHRNGTIQWDNVPKHSPLFTALTARIVAQRLAGNETTIWSRQKCRYEEFAGLLNDRPKNQQRIYAYKLGLSPQVYKTLELGSTKKLNNMLDKLLAGQLPTIELNYGG